MSVICNACGASTDKPDPECWVCQSAASAGYGVNAPTIKIPTKRQFLAMLPAIRMAAEALGYAVGLHGSLARDFDLIAVPWISGASHPDDVAQAIKKAAGCVRWRVFRGHGGGPELHQGKYDDKPHGRLTYCFDWDKQNQENRGYIDLSVMPRLSP